MSIIMRCNTTHDNEEIRKCVKMLRDTDADTGFMHESFYKDDPAKFTRSWFAWVNTLFGEMIYRLVNEGKVDILNNLGYPIRKTILILHYLIPVSFVYLLFIR